jgi:hypothetical protein
VPCVGISATKVILFKEQCVLCRVFSVLGYPHEEKFALCRIFPVRCIPSDTVCVHSVGFFSAQGYP